MEGFEVAIAALLEKMSICEFYAGIYVGARLLSQFTAILDSALPELYAAVIVFVVKARTYFEASGMYESSYNVIIMLIQIRHAKNCKHINVI